MKSRAAVLVTLAVGLGFLAGMAWGRGTRYALPGATRTRFDGGLLTVEIDTGAALASGLLNALR